MSKPSKNKQTRAAAAAPISVEEFERKFDAGENVLEHFVELRAYGANEQIPPIALNTKPKIVNVEFPTWVVDELDVEAETLGIARQAVIKVWITERIRQQKARQVAAL